MRLQHSNYDFNPAEFRAQPEAKAYLEHFTPPSEECLTAMTPDIVEWLRTDSTLNRLSDADLITAAKVYLIMQSKAIFASELANSIVDSFRPEEGGPPQDFPYTSPIRSANNKLSSQYDMKTADFIELLKAMNQILIVIAQNGQARVEVESLDPERLLRDYDLSLEEVDVLYTISNNPSRPAFIGESTRS